MNQGNGRAEISGDHDAIKAGFAVLWFGQFARFAATSVRFRPVLRKFAMPADWEAEREGFEPSVEC